MSGFFFAHRVGVGGSSSNGVYGAVLEGCGESNSPRSGGYPRRVLSVRKCVM